MRTRDPRSLAVQIGLATWLVATALGQHPHRMFGRIRGHDPIGMLIPNWRFFAPIPAQHDFHLLYRVLTPTGEQTPWTNATNATPRAWSHALWFPDRRRDKAVFDLCGQLIEQLALRGGQITGTPAYRLLRDLVAVAVETDHARRPAP